MPAAPSWSSWLVAGLALLGGCASQRIADALQRYGLDAVRAECVADSLADHLSAAQLQSLSRAARAYREADTSPDALTISDLVRVAREIRDPRVPAEIVRAGVQCSVLPPAAPR